MAYDGEQSSSIHRGSPDIALFASCVSSTIFTFILSLILQYRKSALNLELVLENDQDAIAEEFQDVDFDALNRISVGSRLSESNTGAGDAGNGTGHDGASGSSGDQICG